MSCEASCAAQRSLDECDVCLGLTADTAMHESLRLLHGCLHLSLCAIMALQSQAFEFPKTRLELPGIALIGFGLALVFSLECREVQGQG